MADDSEGDGGQQVGLSQPLRRTASKRGSRVIRLVGRRSRKPENLAARPLGRRISRKLIERFASLSLAKLVNSRRSRLPCAVRAWPRSEATSKLKGNLSPACGLPSAKSVQEMSNCLTRRWSTSRCARHEETVLKGRAFVRPSSKSTPDDILTDVWDRTLSLSARAQNRLNATSLALDHLRQQLTREAAAEQLLPQILTTGLYGEIWNS